MARSYIERLKWAHGNLMKSRVVTKGESDEDALGFFEHYCNESLPQTPEEVEFRTLVKNMYFTDKTAFGKCVREQPFLMLLTEARAFVYHFKVQNLIYIRWNGKSYNITVNDNPTEKHYSKRERRASTRKTYKAILDRVTQLEKNLALESIEPDLEPEDKPGKISWADIV